MNTSKIDEAIPVRVTTWYSCEIPGRATFGFSVNSYGYITSFPEKNFVGDKITSHRQWFVDRKATAIKICEQIEK